MKKQHNFQKQNGFTLVELLIGMTIFSLFLGATVGVLIFAIRIQRRFLLQQNVLGQLNFDIEYMNRALRMAVKEGEDGECISAGTSYENINGDSSISFINHLQGDDCQEFFLENNILKYRKGINAQEETFDLTSPKVEIIDLDFSIIGGSGEDDIQPRVTIKIKGNVQRLNLPILLQTTVSQRNLDI